MAKRKFFVETTTSKVFEISELDFNNLKGRISRGTTKGWYMQRGETVGDIADWRIQIKDIAMFFSDKDEPKNEPVRDIDVEKRVPPEVGAKDPKPEPDKTCVHNWQDPSQFTYVTQIVNGVNRYFKQCNKCNGKSTLIKKREVEVAMKASGESINDVPLVD